MTMSPRPTNWPKQLPPLTPEQIAIRDDYMAYFYDGVYSERYGVVQRFNHTYAARTAGDGPRTLDLGAGLGEHVEYEQTRGKHYVALELRPEMAAAIESKYPEISVCTGDAQAGLAFDAGTFDRVLAIHVLEHLPNLPAALEEVHRVLRPGGAFSVVLPCEGGFGYSLGRRLTTKRLFERRYGISYDWCIESEHVNTADEVTVELDSRFAREHRAWFPLRIPTVHVNVCVGLTYRRV
jgi:SAM-dependent methyltransferase